MASPSLSLLISEMGITSRTLSRTTVRCKGGHLRKLSTKPRMESIITRIILCDEWVTECAPLPWIASSSWVRAGAHSHSHLLPRGQVPGQAQSQSSIHVCCTTD